MFCPLSSSFVTLITLISLTNGYHKLSYNHLLLKLNHANFNLSEVNEKWIKQPLDHFNSYEERTFQMRYFERLDLWQPGGPVYVFIGGEGSQDSSWIGSRDTLITQIAEETRGAIFATEHRYYGYSLPNLPPDNLMEYYKFLSSQQALADIAYFITLIKALPKYKASKIVVIGGSYAGNLAAWLRELYPHLVDAAVASSAPVLAKKDFHEYLDIVRYTYGKYGGKKCLNDIGYFFNRYERLLKTDEGIRTIKKELNICPNTDLTVIENQQFLFFHFYSLLGSVVQYGSPNEIYKHCNHYRRKSFPMSKNQGCLNLGFRKPGAWTYQFCNEFGYFITTSSEKQPFVHWQPLDFWLKMCKSAVKGNVERAVDRGVAVSNKMYGGRTPNVTKVAFTHGDMDPWHTLGVLRDLGPDAPVTFAKGTSHCAILTAHDNEPPELTQNREYVKALIRKWIGH